jgi:peptidoglycan/xylan/chitin deacetylase (PgdA/CDA1 family)
LNTGTALRRLARRLQPLVPSAAGGVHVLAYHLVEGGTASPVDLPLDSFRRQMEELARLGGGGRVLSLGEAVRRLTGGESADGGVSAVVLTFDDAYQSFRTHAFPVLSELGLPATLYVPTGFVARETPGPLAGARDLPALDWSELAELAATGLVTVGSHTHSHRDLDTLARSDAGAMRDEVVRSKDLLEEHLGRPVEHFAYPRARRSDAAEAEVRALYRTAVVAGGRANRPRSFHPYRISRLPVRRDMPARLSPLLSRRFVLEERLAAAARALRR